jgi:1-acyl-sn-glycerol-3-phosphate acyltransferase
MERWYRATGVATRLARPASLSYAYAVRALMRRPAALARETGAPLVPLALWGTQRSAVPPSWGRPTMRG